MAGLSSRDLPRLDGVDGAWSPLMRGGTVRPFATHGLQALVGRRQGCCTTARTALTTCSCYASFNLPLISASIVTHYWDASLGLQASSTPFWHRAGTMRHAGAILILLHLLRTTIFRTRIFCSHLRHQPHVRRTLARTGWKGQLKQAPLPLLLAHGWVTGIAANLAAVMPWAALLAVREQSLLLLPVAIAADLACTGLHRGLRSVVEQTNVAFYRNHWLAHHSNFHFVYLHGMHHDALPFGAIAVGEEGALGELVRRLFAVERNAFQSHLSLYHSSTEEMIKAMVWHQYIPGVFPYTRANRLIGNHHVEHHFLHMKPLAFGSTLDFGTPQGAVETTVLDATEGDGYVPDNATWRWWCALSQQVEDASRPMSWWEKRAIG